MGKHYRAVSNKGDLAFTINRGKNNTDTFMWFMMKLCKHLNSQDMHWRNHAIIAIDNALYHCNAERLEYFKRLKMPIMFLGPYHFKLAPVELYFSYIKGFDLHPFLKATSG